MGQLFPVMAACDLIPGTRTFNTRSRPLQRLLEDDSGCPARAGTPRRQTLHGGILRQIVRSRAHWRWHRALPRPALLRPDRGIGVVEHPVRTLALALLNLGWGRHCKRLRSALDEFGAVLSFAKVLPTGGSGRSAGKSSRQMRNIGAAHYMHAFNLRIANSYQPAFDAAH
jgi:hypothetical protein